MMWDALLQAGHAAGAAEIEMSVGTLRPCTYCDSCTAYRLVPPKVLPVPLVMCPLCLLPFHTTCGAAARDRLAKIRTPELAVSERLKVNGQRPDKQTIPGRFRLLLCCPCMLWYDTEPKDSAAADAADADGGSSSPSDGGSSSSD